MSVLTMHELRMFTTKAGAAAATAEELKAAVDKLEEFQASKTCPKQIKQVNSFIPQAQAFGNVVALEKVKEHGGQLDDYFTQAYMDEMNRQAVEAGIRICSSRIS